MTDDRILTKKQQKLIAENNLKQMVNWMLERGIKPTRIRVIVERATKEKT